MNKEKGKPDETKTQQELTKQELADEELDKASGGSPHTPYIPPDGKRSPRDPYPRVKPFR